MKATNKLEMIRYYRTLGDQTYIYNIDLSSVSIESSVDIKQIRKIYSPLKLYKMPVWLGCNID